MTAYLLAPTINDPKPKPQPQKRSFATIANRPRHKRQTPLQAHSQTPVHANRQTPLQVKRQAPTRDAYLQLTPKPLLMPNLKAEPRGTDQVVAGGAVAREHGVGAGVLKEKGAVQAVEATPRKHALQVAPEPRDGGESEQGRASARVGGGREGRRIRGSGFALWGLGGGLGTREGALGFGVFFCG